jgi:ParB family chromosome partitioning protein
MAKKKALGRGLAAILNDADKKVERKDLRQKKEKNIIDHIDIEGVEKNPFQPRVKFDEIELKELASSIIELGIVQPITVRKLNKNKYQLISGERRFLLL